MPAPAPRRKPEDPAAILERLQQFLATSEEPALLEPGQEAVALEAGAYSLDLHPGGCVLHAWGAGGNVVRRITAVEGDDGRRLELRARRFGSKEARLSLIDRARREQRIEKRNDALRFQKRLCRLLERDWPDWRVEGATTAPDLRRTLSGLYVRAEHVQGRQAWAVIAAPPDASAESCDRLLTFGLIWLAAVRSDRPDHVCRGLRLFTPRGKAAATARRIPWLDASKVRCELFEYTPRGELWPIDPAAQGNDAGSLTPCLPPPEPDEPVRSWLAELLAQLDVDATPRTDGLLSLRVHGVEFARAGRTVMSAGLEQRTPVAAATFPGVVEMARQIARRRSADSPDTADPLFARHPEAWLESQIRRGLRLIDPSLLSTPVYSQTPALTAGARNIVDLLASDALGRLTLLELKAAEDPHLPLQTLDYWAAVRERLRAGDLEAHRYFPALTLPTTAPRVLLVAPALAFHPTTETILAFLSPEIPLERIGLGSDWRRRLEVVFRRRGPKRLD